MQKKISLEDIPKDAKLFKTFQLATLFLPYTFNVQYPQQTIHLAKVWACSVTEVVFSDMCGLVLGL